MDTRNRSRFAALPAALAIGILVAATTRLAADVTLTRLTSGNDGFASPCVDLSGKLLIYVTSDDLVLSDVKTGEAATIASGGVQRGHVAGKKLVAFSSTGDHTGGNADGNAEVFIYEIKTGLVTQVTDTTGVANTDVTVDKKGRQVAFLSPADLTGGNADGNAEIFVYDVAGAIFTQVTDTSAGEEHGNPLLHSNGKHVFFDSDADLSSDVAVDNADGNKEVFRCTLKTGVFEQLTDTTNGDCERPSASKSGKIVAFHSTTDGLIGPNGDGSREVYVHNVAKGLTARITSSLVDTENPAMAGNGRALVIETTADFFGLNGDGSKELVLAFLNKDGSVSGVQLTDGAGGTQCVSATGSTSGRSLFFESDADLTGDGAGFDHVFLMQF